MLRQPILVLGRSLLCVAFVFAGLGPVGAQPVDDHDAHPAAAAPHGDPDILEPQPNLATYTLVVFAIVFLLLWRFAWGPLSKALHDREQRQEQAFKDAERARAEAAALLAKHQEQMDQAQEQVRAIMEEARRDAQTTASDILRQAQEEAESTRLRATREIGMAKDQALMEIWSKSADLAIGIAHRVMARELNEEDHRRLVELATTELPTGPGGQTS